MQSYSRLDNYAWVCQVVSYCCNWQARLQYRHIPGPAPSFPLGNLQTVLKKQLFRAHQDWQKMYGDVYKFFWGRQPVIVITGQS